MAGTRGDVELGETSPWMWFLWVRPRSTLCGVQQREPSCEDEVCVAVTGGWAPSCSGGLLRVGARGPRGFLAAETAQRCSIGFLLSTGVQQKLALPHMSTEVRLEQRLLKELSSCIRLPKMPAFPVS